MRDVAIRILKNIAMTGHFRKENGLPQPVYGLVSQ